MTAFTAFVVCTHAVPGPARRAASGLLRVGDALGIAILSVFARGSAGHSSAL
jgi:hypothetical protein